MSAAEKLAEETVQAAQLRAREIESRTERDRQEGERVIGQLTAARQVLASRLTAAHSGLEQVFTDVGDANAAELLPVSISSADEGIVDDFSEPGS